MGSSGAGGGRAFADRADAGRRLAAELAHLRDEHPVVLGLPRGGVAVAAQVADALGEPLDVVLVRKLGVPFQPELAFGAVGEGGVRVLDDEVRRAVELADEVVAATEARERAELDRQARRFREARPPLDLRGRTVVLVDDGIATGSTARAACAIARAHGAERVVVATPVAPAQTLERLRAATDEIACLRTPEPFFAIGEWYADFTQTSDDEVVEMLRRAEESRRPAHGNRPRASEKHGEWSTVIDEDVGVPAGSGDEYLPGRLTVPAGALGVVVFAHGGSAPCTRDHDVATRLRAAGVGTLLLELLDPGEARDPARGSDTELLGARVVAAARWTAAQRGLEGLPLGCLGTGIAAAAVLRAASGTGALIAAVVSRGARTALAGDLLASVRCPTLLVVGELDEAALEHSRTAFARLRCTKRLDVVPGATDRFEEPGALEKVACLAADWFAGHLGAAGHVASRAEGATRSTERADATPPKAAPEERSTSQ